MQPIVIIDGNNLAQLKYGLQGKPVTIKYDRMLIHDLAAWAKRQQEACSVEMFLDPRVVIPEPAGTVHIHAANRGESADPHIKDFVRHCVSSKKACIVITDDTDLTEYANRQGVVVVAAREFIKFPTLLNLLPADFEKETYPYLTPTPGASPPEPDNPMRVAANPSDREPQKTGKIAAPELLDVHQRTYQGRMAKASSGPGQADDAAAAQEAPPPAPIRMVRLTLDTWPLDDGYQFLTRLVCPQHRAEYQSLLGRPKQAARSDLYSYYQLVLEICDAEPDFYTRGTALMDKVRLRLMQVHPGGLALAELEQQFGDQPGFRHKLSVHNGKSIALFEMDAAQDLPE